MAGEITLRLEDITVVSNNLKTATSGIEPEVRLAEGLSKIESLNKYRENMERMSGLIKSYMELLEEDTERIHNAALSLIEYDSGLLS